MSIFMEAVDTCRQGLIDFSLTVSQGRGNDARSMSAQTATCKWLRSIHLLTQPIPFVRLVVWKHGVNGRRNEVLITSLTNDLQNAARS